MHLIFKVYCFLHLFYSKIYSIPSIMLFIITGSHNIDKRKCYVHRRTETKPQISGQLKSSERTWRVRAVSLDLLCLGRWQRDRKLTMEAQEGEAGHLG